MNKHLPFSSIKFILGAFITSIIFSCQSKPKNDSLEQTTQPWHFPYFKKVDSLNPILSPSSELTFTDPITGTIKKWEERNVLNPTAVVRNDSVFMLYRAQDSLGTSRIGLAVSTDGLHFIKMPSPVFFPDLDAMKVFEWNYQKNDIDATLAEACNSCYFDGVEDPRIIENEDGVYFMTYTSYDGRTARLSIASSKDLIHWNKHGLVLADDKYKETWSKAGAIVGGLQGNRIVARKIDGYYWMYFGDTSLSMAFSKDLIHWNIAINEESKKPITVLHPRMGLFDSRLVEPGPYALLKEEGILLIYNASNAANFNDPNLPKFTYAAGQALFDKNRPYRLIDRTDGYFIYPDKDYEKVGEVNEVCFVEGLVYFKEQWFLYYGTADSKIAVAVYKPE